MQILLRATTLIKGDLQRSGAGVEDEIH